MTNPKNAFIFKAHADAESYTSVFGKNANFPLIQNTHEELMNRRYVHGTSSQQVIKNSLYNSGAWILSVVIAILATPYFVLRLTVEGYGVYVLIRGVMGYSSLVDFGLGQGVIKFVAHYRTVGNDNGISNSINAALLFQIAMGVLGSILIWMFSDSIVKLLNISARFGHDALVGIKLSSLGFIFTMAGGTFRSVAIGYQRYDYTSKIAIANNLVLMGAMILSLILGYGLKLLILLNVIDSFILLVAYVLLVKKIFPGWIIGVVPPLSYFTRMLTYSVFIFISKIVSNFNNYLVKFIISAFLGPMAVTMYDLPIKIIGAFKGIVSQISNVFFPFSSELGAIQNYERIRNAYVRTSKWIIALELPIFILMSICSRQILTLWIGEDFATKDWLVMSILSVAYFLSTLTMIPVNMALGLGFSKVVSILSVSVVFIEVVSIYAMINHFGLYGVAMSLLLAQIIAVPILLFYVTKRVIFYDISLYMRRVYSLPLALYLGSIALFLLEFSSFQNLQVYLGLILAASYAGAIYFVIFITKYADYKLVAHYVIRSRI